MTDILAVPASILPPAVLPAERASAPSAAVVFAPIAGLVEAEASVLEAAPLSAVEPDTSGVERREELLQAIRRKRAQRQEAGRRARMYANFAVSAQLVAVRRMDD